MQKATSPTSESQSGDAPGLDPIDGAASEGVRPGAFVFDQVGKTFVRGKRIVEAVRNVTLTVHAGEFLTILGPSGCGKSTLLHIAGGFETPTTCRALLDGEAVVKPGRDRGMVFQHATLFPWKTVLKNVSWFFEVNGVRGREARDRAKEYLALVGLSEFHDSYPHELSGGMRQRAALARTLALQPKVLLMDEPFGALDAMTREVLQEELTSIWQQAALTVIFITHDIHEAVFLGDRVVVMSARPGRIVEDVKIKLDRPRSSDTKDSSELLEYYHHFRELIRQEPSVGVEDGAS